MININRDDVPSLSRSLFVSERDREIETKFWETETESEKKGDMKATETDIDLVLISRARHQLRMYYIIIQHAHLPNGTIKLFEW